MMAAATRVLYVDDEPSLLDLCKTYLERSGDFIVTTAISAPDAIRLVEQERFDVIVSDYQMPEMNGIEFLKAIRARGAKTPFIIFTGKGREEIVIEALNSGADFYLQKGGEPKSQFAELSHKIRHAISSRQADKALIESEERYHLLFNSIDEGFCIIEVIFDENEKPIDYRFLEINPSFEKQTGLINAQGKRMRELAPKHEEHWFEIYGNIAITGKPARFVNRAEQLHRWYDVYAFRFGQPENRQVAILFNDITERKRAETDLIAAQQQYRELFESVNIGILRSTPEPQGVFVEANPAALRIFDADSREQLLAVHLSDLYLDHDQRRRISDEILAKDIIKGMEVRYKTLKGREIWGRFTSIKKIALDGQIYFDNTIEDITERKLAEEKIKTSEMRYRRLFESAKDGILILNQDTGEIIDANPFIENLLGYSPREFIGKHLWDIGLFKDTLTSKIAFEELQTKKYIRYEDLPLETKDGQRIDVEFISNLYSVNNTSVIQCNIRDITERKKAAYALKINFARLDSAMDAGNLAWWEMDCQTGAVAFSEKKAKMLGYSPDHFSHYSDFTALLHPDDLEPAMQAMRDHLNSTTPAYDIEYRIRTITGEYRWFHDSGRITEYNPDKTPKKVTGLVLDITERKQAEEEMKRSLERFKAVMDGLDALVYVVDMKTFELIFLNKYGKDVWGEIEGQTCWKTIQSGQSGICPFCTNDKLVDSNGNPTGVYRWEFQNTVTRKWYYCCDSAIRWIDGRLVRLEIATDITERKQAADMLALTNRKLTLMNDVTYQYLQNKITALRGYAELSKDVKTKAERLSFIEKEEHLLVDIHQLIKNTRQYQEIGLIQSQWILVEQSIRIAVSLVSPRQGISIEITLHGLELYTDPIIEKIFVNLVDNAVKHGKTLTRIRFSCEEKPEGLILICEDDGVGISPKDKVHFFDSSGDRYIHFGLFFIRECLALYGMTIAETGEPGKGSRFEITVPKGMFRFTGTGEK